MRIFSAIVLSLILLLQTVGLTFGTHYCGGKAVKTSLMVATTDLDCGMMKRSASCESHGVKEGFNRPDCCQNELVSLATDHEFISSDATRILTDFLQYTAATQQFLDYTAPTPYSADYSKYAPPLISSDLQPLLQVFRI